LESKNKKVTFSIDRKLADHAKSLAEKRGQTLGEFHRKLYIAALSGEKFLEWAKKESIKDLKNKHAA